MNADQGIALTSILVGGTISVVSVVASGISSAKDRTAAAAQAKVERDQVRKQEAYLALLRFVERVGHWVALLRTALDTPTLNSGVPSSEEEVAVKALVGAYASPEVRKRFAAWIEAVNEVRFADARIAGLVRADATLRVVDWSDRLDSEFKPGERTAREALTAQVALDLTASS